MENISVANAYLSDISSNENRSKSLKEFNSSSTTILLPEKSTISKVFAQECKECYNIEDPRKLRFKDVFRLKEISFLLMLYFLIFLGFNIFHATFSDQAV